MCLCHKYVGKEERPENLRHQSVPKLAAGVSEWFNKKKRLSRKRQGGKLEKEDDMISKGIRICEPSNEGNVERRLSVLA